MAPAIAPGSSVWFRPRGCGHEMVGRAEFALPNFPGALPVWRVRAEMPGTGEVTTAFRYGRELAAVEPVALGWVGAEVEAEATCGQGAERVRGLVAAVARKAGEFGYTLFVSTDCGMLLVRGDGEVRILGPGGAA